MAIFLGVDAREEDYVEMKYMDMVQALARSYKHLRDANNNIVCDDALAQLLQVDVGTHIPMFHIVGYVCALHMPSVLHQDFQGKRFGDDIWNLIH